MVMRRELAECVRIDEALLIRDKAAALAAYMRQRDDNQAAVQLKVIVHRACLRIGVLSAEMEKHEQAHGGRHPTDGKPTKTKALADAGLSKSAAHRYEQLAATDVDENLQQLGMAAGDLYLEECLTAGVEPTQEELLAVVRKAVGAPPAKKPEPLSQRALDEMRELESPRCRRWSDALKENGLLAAIPTRSSF
jgi:hypothetical protein